MLSEYILRDLDRRIDDIKDTTQAGLTELKFEIRMLENRLLDQIGRLEQNSKRPSIDFNAIFQSLWFRIGIFILLGASNKELIEALASSFRN